MPKTKKKVKSIKPIFNDNSADAPLSFDIHKTIEDSKKVKPQDVFEGYKKGKSKNKKIDKV